MALQVSKRERMLLIITVAALAIALFYQFGLESGIGAVRDYANQLKAEKQRYDDYVNWLRRRDAIQRRYDELAKNYNIGIHSDVGFTPMIERAFRDIGLAPDIRTPTTDFLYDGAKDLGRITLQIMTEGDVEKVGRMLQFFDEQLIEVNILKLEAHVDSPIIKVDATVSQIIELTPEMRKKLRDRKGAGGRPGTPRRRTPGEI